MAVVVREFAVFGFAMVLAVSPGLADQPAVPAPAATATLPAQNAPLDCAAVIKDRDDGKITTKTEARQLIECLKTNFGDPGRLGGGPGSISTAQQPPPAYLLGDPSNILPQDFIGTYNNGLQS